MIGVAKEAVNAGLVGERFLPEVDTYPEPLARPGASFVTLNMSGQLRGCIGTLEAYQPLIVDVARNAYSAAFRDPRFPGLQQHEFEFVEFHVSVLSEPETMHVTSEGDLLSQLRPFIDGVILEEGRYRGTFLPAVWESLPDPVEFLNQLKRKAGLPVNYWSDNIRISRYTADQIT